MFSFAKQSQNIDIQSPTGEEEMDCQVASEMNYKEEDI